MYTEPITDSEDESDDYGDEIVNFMIDREAVERILGTERLL